MSNWFRRDPGPSDEVGRDIALAEALEVLDPASQDPNYWFRFRGWVMTGAARELARRRLIAEITVGDVLTSWARAVVPTAVLAAALAAIVLMRAGTVPTQHPIGVEELLMSEIPSEIVPVLLSPDETAGVVAFASEIF
jgi:hypothetical protein